MWSGMIRVTSSSSLGIAAVLLCMTGYVSGQEACKVTGWNFKDKKCANGWEELWKDQAAGQTNRACCDPKGDKYEDYVKAYKATCRVSECQPSSSGGNLCSGFYDRYKKGKKLSYEEILREPCTTTSGSHGAVGLCCEKDSMEGVLATTLGSEPNEFPHQAKLRLPGHCGGTVYNKKWIVTAAHCIVDDGVVQDAEPVEVVLGSNMGEMKSKEYVYKVKRLIPHQNYSRLANNPEFKKGEEARIFNDIAMMELDREIQFGPHVKALEIAPKGFNAYNYSDKGIIIGWGTTDTLEISQHLQKANLYLRKDLTCFENDSEKRYGPYFNMDKLANQLFCIGGIIEGKWSPTAGGGDSGGPAICRGRDGKIVLCGVTSFGGSDEKCAANDDEENCPPSVYAEVAYFHDWIKKTGGPQDPSTFYKPYLYGEPVPKGKYEHQVRVTSSDGKSCGGTLVAPNFVVTAAQCVMKAAGKSYNGIKVTTGTTDLKGKGKTYEVAGVAGLPGFEDRKSVVNVKKQGNRVRLTDNYYKNDLAVLKLKSNVDISPNKLPSFPEFNPELGTEIAFPRPTETNPDTQLKSRSFRFLGQSECQTRMDRLHRAGLDIKVDKNILCGVETYSGGSLCDRELGGGIICKGPNGKEQLCGVQIFRMCESSVPNGFMNMVLFKDWVRSAMKQMRRKRSRVVVTVT